MKYCSNLPINVTFNHYSDFNLLHIIRFDKTEKELTNMKIRFETALKKIDDFEKFIKEN